MTRAEGTGRFLAAVAVAALWDRGTVARSPRRISYSSAVWSTTVPGSLPGPAGICVMRGRISFVGDAAGAARAAGVVVDVGGLVIPPGFIDMRSHAKLTVEFGRTHYHSSIGA